MTATHDKEWKIVNKARDGSKFYSKDGKRCWDIPFDLEDQLRRDAKEELILKMQKSITEWHNVNTISKSQRLSMIIADMQYLIDLFNETERAKTLGEQQKSKAFLSCSSDDSQQVKKE